MQRALALLAVVKAAEQLRIRLGGVELVEPQPLHGKGFRQLAHARIAEQAARFRGEHAGFAERCSAQGVVGRRGPEEVGEAVRELVVVESADGGAARHGLGEVEEIRRGQHGGERLAHRGGKGRAGLDRLVVEPDVARDRAFIHRSPERPREETAEPLAGDVVLFARRHFQRRDRLRRGIRRGGDETEVVEQHVVAAEFRAVDLQLRDVLARRRAKREERVPFARALRQLGGKRVRAAAAEFHRHRDSTALLLPAERAQREILHALAGQSALHGEREAQRFRALRLIREKRFARRFLRRGKSRDPQILPRREPQRLAPIEPEAHAHRRPAFHHPIARRRVPHPAGAFLRGGVHVEAELIRDRDRAARRGLERQIEIRRKLPRRFEVARLRRVGCDGSDRLRFRCDRRIGDERTKGGALLRKFRAFHDRAAQRDVFLQQQRREVHRLAAIVKTVLGAVPARQPGIGQEHRVFHPILAHRYVHALGHPARARLEVIAHHRQPLGEDEDVELQPEEIAHRVVVFQPREPPQHRASRITRAELRIRSRGDVRDPRQHLRALRVRRLRIPLRRRHLVRFHLAENRRPNLAIRQHRRVRAEAFEVHATLRLLLIAVTVEAVLFQKGQDFASEVRRRVRGRRHAEKSEDAAAHARTWLIAPVLSAKRSRFTPAACASVSQRFASGTSPAK